MNPKQLFFFGVVLAGVFFIPFLPMKANALIDATLPDDGEPVVKELTGTNWIILRKRLSWLEASAFCELHYYRLTMLPTKEKAEELINKIASISVPYNKAYDMKYMTVEFGMDRRYWIGLTDQVEDEKWYWTDDGTPLKYNYWYPGQPDHKMSSVDNRREHCVALWNPGYHYSDKHSFNDEACLNENYAICDIKDEDPEHAAMAKMMSSGIGVTELPSGPLG